MDENKIPDNTFFNGIFNGLGKIKARFDGWRNVFTGIGVRKTDKRMHGEIWWEPLTMQECAHLYMQDDVAGRLCDKLPDAMTKAWVEWFIKDSDEMKAGQAADIKEQITNRFEELNTRNVFNKAMKYANIFGGGAVFVITDEEDFSQPIGKFSKILKLHPMHRFELIWASLNADIKAENFSRPEQYWLINQRAVPIAQMLIHTSRLIKFNGVEAPPFMQPHLSFWGDSKLTRTFNTIRNYQTSNDLAISALNDYSIGVFKMRNLSNLIAAGKENQIVSRLEIANLGRSVIKSMVIDETESYEHVTRSLSGVPEILTKSEDRMVSASGMPHTILLGDSPTGGIGATGNHEMDNWYDRVKENQENYLAPQLDFLCRLVEEEMGGKIEIGYKFNSLYQTDEDAEKAKQLKQAQIDGIYIDKGVVTPEDISESRYTSSGQWQDKTIIKTLNVNMEDPKKSNLSDPVIIQTTDPKKLTTLPYSNLNIMQGDPAYPEKTQNSIASDPSGALR